MGGRRKVYETEGQQTGVNKNGPECQRGEGRSRVTLFRP